MHKAKGLRIPFTWKDRHPVFMDRCLYIPGFYQGHDAVEKIPWTDSRFFGNDHPVYIEYCSGNGLWISEKAKKHPEINWVAVEKRFDRASKAWALFQSDHLSNVFMVCSEAIVFSRYYVPMNSVSAAFVNFPDPWPKLRHAKHRLVRKEFLQELKKILNSEGTVTFATDDQTYAGQMLDVLKELPEWRSVFPEPYFIHDWPDFGASFFSDLWSKKGLCTHYLQFKLERSL